MFGDEKDEATQPNGSDGGVTDADLDAVAETIESEGEAEEKVEEVEKKPDLDNWEKTKMGRKIAAQGGDISELKTMMGQVLSKLENPVKADPNSIENLPPETPATKQDVIDIVEAREKKTTNTQIAYKSDFISSAQDMGLLDEHAELHQAVMDEMADNDKYRRSLSSDGKSDGKINYLEAKIAVVSRMAKVKGKPNPLDKNTDITPANLGVGSDSKITSKKVASIKLDPIAAEFVKDRGMSEESVKKALEKELPAQLSGTGGK